MALRVARLLEEPLPSAPAAPRGKACERCGTPVEPQDRFCQDCGLPQASAAPTQPAPKQKYLRCKNCSAEIAVDPDQRSYVCPFCDSTYVEEFAPAQSGRQEPEFVIGFSVTVEQAQEKFRNWLGAGGWFRPGDLRLAKIEEKLKGLYLPFWSFSLLAESVWSASIGEHWYRTETYTTTENGKTVTHTRQVQETEWWDLAGKHHSYYSGYLIPGSRSLDNSYSQKIQPYQLPALKRYEPYFLAGWLNEEYTVPRDEAFETCQAEFQRREQGAVGSFLPGDTHRGLDVQTQFSDVNSDLILLPVYLLSYRYGEKVYRFLLNGQTGRVAGDKPLSMRRILAAIGVAAVVILILVILFGRR